MTPAGRPGTLPRRYPAPMADQAMCCARMIHDATGRCVVTFAGSVDAERMARAVRLTLDAQPVLGCRLVPHPWRPYWEREPDLDSRQYFSLVQGADTQIGLERFMADAPDPRHALPLHVGLFRGSSDTLCIRISHEVADAGGLLEYLSLLARTYRALGSDPGYHPPCDGLGERGNGQVLRRMGLRRLALACRYLPNPRAKWGFITEDGDQTGRSFVARSLGPEYVAALKCYARQENATLNDVLLTAFYRALMAIVDPHPGIPLKIQNTTSLRPYRPKENLAICNLVSIYYHAISRVPDEPFAATLSRVHAAQQAQLANDSWLAAIVLAEVLYVCGYAIAGGVTRAMFRHEARRGTAAPIYANLGVITRENADFGAAHVAGITVYGPVPYSPLTLLTIHTFAGTMTFTSAARGGLAATRQLERLVDLCVSELAAVCLAIQPLFPEGIPRPELTAVEPVAISR